MWEKTWVCVRGVLKITKKQEVKIKCIHLGLFGKIWQLSSIFCNVRGDIFSIMVMCKGIYSLVYQINQFLAILYRPLFTWSKSKLWSSEWWLKLVCFLCVFYVKQQLFLFLSWLIQLSVCASMPETIQNVHIVKVLLSLFFSAILPAQT